MMGRATIGCDRPCEAWIDGELPTGYAGTA